jgi:2-polyprenyl-6-methoxyphenol hydroxylase-like FAD-dependent oxidoreductase
MDHNRDILISGASVAGPALAWWLSRRGFRPTVVERAPRLRSGGYTVDFRGAAHLGVLAKMGLLDAVKARQTRLSRITLVDQQGGPVARMPAHVFAGDVEILRGDLARILYEATQGTTEYLFGDSITRLDEHPRGVRVSFERSKPRTFSLVIGADGLHSNVRALAFGEHGRFIEDLGLAVSIFSMPGSPGLDHAGLLCSVPGRTAGVFSAGHNQAIAQLYFAAPGAGYAHGDTARQKQIVAEAFAGMGQKQARSGTGFLAPPTPEKIAQLRRFYRMLPYLPVKHLMKYLTTRTATGIRLPSYSR